VLPEMSRTAPTLVGRLTISEQVAHKLVEYLAERFADRDIAVSIAETGKRTSALAVYFRDGRDRDKLRAAVAAAAGRGLIRVTRWPSSRNGPGIGNTRRFPCRSSSVTASFSSATTAPQKRASKSSTTSPCSASTWSTGPCPGLGLRF